MGGFIFNFCLFTNTLTIDSLPFLDWHKLQHHHRSSCYHSQQNMIQFCLNFQILKTSKVDIQSFPIHTIANFHRQYFVLLFSKNVIYLENIVGRCWNWLKLALFTNKTIATSCLSSMHSRITLFVAFCVAIKVCYLCWSNVSHLQNATFRLKRRQNYCCNLCFNATFSFSIDFVFCVVKHFL